MGGIAGIVDFQGKRENIELIKQMTASFSHRGPDGCGIKVLGGGSVFLGHRRLSVIDLSNYASQPMQVMDGRYTIVYNGEIYNYRELKTQLLNKGYSFFSNSDTEVLLNCYAEWGTECLQKLNGAFSFAIWDEYESRMFIARDRYGIKPLYYARIGQDLLFASEQKALMLHPRFVKKLNQQILKEYFTFQNILSDDMLMDGIKILEAGTYLIVTRSNTCGYPVRYWDYNFEEPEAVLQEEIYKEEFQFLFRQSVQRQLIGDVEIGAYLSGGIDSGAITAVASTLTQDLKTFTCGFDLHSVSGIEMIYDERDRSELMSYLFGTEHYEIVLKAGDMQRCMEKLVRDIEEPRMGQCYPNFYVTRLASKFVKVVLSGAGGDEMFGGYPWRYYRSVYNESFDDYADKYYAFWQRLVDEKTMPFLFKPIWNDVCNIDMRDKFKSIFKNVNKQNVSPAQCVNLSMYFEAKTFLHGLLVLEDKISMSNGLETRTPFLDNDLVDFALKLPAKMKLNKLQEFSKMDENEIGSKSEKYYQRTKDGKLLMRKSLESLLPAEVFKADKQGFSPPDTSWQRGESMEYIKHIVFNNSAVMYDYLDKSTVQSLTCEHLNGEHNYRLFIWSVLVFDQWCKNFL